MSEVRERVRLDLLAALNRRNRWVRWAALVRWEVKRTTHELMTGERDWETDGEVEDELATTVAWFRLARREAALIGEIEEAYTSGVGEQIRLTDRGRATLLAWERPTWPRTGSAA